MIIKIIANIALIIILSIAQVSFISGLPGIASDVNLILVALIFILGFFNFDLALLWVLGIGFFMDIFSFSVFGVYIFSLSAAIAAANLSLNYFFTNRSLYSFSAMAGISIFVYESAVYFFVLIFSEANPAMAGGFWIAFLTRVFLNILLSAAVYYAVYFFGKKFKPVFLIKNKN